MKIKFERYLISFDDSIQYEEFKEQESYGIIFRIHNSRYEVIHCLLGDRLLLSLNYQSGFPTEWKDIPFHMGTARFLPDEIQVTEL